MAAKRAPKGATTPPKARVRTKTAPKPALEAPERLVAADPPLAPINEPTRPPSRDLVQSMMRQPVVDEDSTPDDLLDGIEQRIASIRQLPDDAPSARVALRAINQITIYISRLRDTYGRRALGR